ncbi:aspartate dehydrogenase [Granulosicoccus antarcticus]|uniref:L-aspartate dehydrogenase n=1 Tax=Granulosicoccus antarcticus IMCC3135 TaxID=1192854 RepID=A0A2Z2NZ71_9GAMM|nr:aspartate dehydrogenase [Granulosicoccus antarcticus]ASJ74170.1 L-aspartate dehydrogenase [Granulosicoccus antarcticus IMCC3135]
MQQILLIGFGAIGQYVHQALQISEHSRIAAVLCRPGREAAVREALGESMVCVSDLSKLPPLDLAIECAGHAGFAQHVPALLHWGLDVLAVSSGALAARDLASQVEQASTMGQSHLALVSGAIGGMDALSAASIGGLNRVVYRGRKPVQGWRGSPAEKLLVLDELSTATTFFTGSAREAALQYPKNANVAATIALAGIGFDKTTVELIADPDITANRHEIEAQGVFGKLQFSIEGEALPGNPRSSALTAMSLVKAVEKRGSSLRLV